MPSSTESNTNNLLGIIEQGEACCHISASFLYQNVISLAEIAEKGGTNSLLLDDASDEVPNVQLDCNEDLEKSSQDSFSSSAHENLQSVIPY